MSKTMHLFGCAVMVFAMIVSFGTPTAAAAKSSVDVDLVRDIARAVNQYALLTVFDDIKVDFDEEGSVTLTGSVTSPHKKTDIVERVAAVDGVTTVLDEIDVLPFSAFDNDLRYRVARAIYGSSAFWQYAARSHPPIHIVVNRGHVTLTGVVDTEVDRAIAGSLASQLGAFSLTNELQLPTTLGSLLDQGTS